MTSSLIDELLRDASDKSVSISNLLRKALVIASKLQIPEVPDWIQSELTGYRGSKEVPPHRIIHGVVRAQAHGGWVPIEFPNSDFTDSASQHEVREPIAEIEGLAHNENELHITFAPEHQAILRHMFQRHALFGCFFSNEAMASVVEAVRTKVLLWAIELDRAGVRGDGLSFTPREREIAHNISIESGGGSITFGVIGSVSGKPNIAVAGSTINSGLGSEDVQVLVREIRELLSAMPAMVQNDPSVVSTLYDIEKNAETKSIDTVKVASAVKRFLGAIGTTTQSVLVSALSAYVGAWLKSRGLE